MAYWIRLALVPGKAENAEALSTAMAARRQCGFFRRTPVAPMVFHRFVLRMRERHNPLGSLSWSPRRANSSCREMLACFCASNSSPRRQHTQRTRESGGRVGTHSARVLRGKGAHTRYSAVWALGGDEQ